MNAINKNYLLDDNYFPFLLQLRINSAYLYQVEIHTKGLDLNMCIAMQKDKFSLEYSAEYVDICYIAISYAKDMGTTLVQEINCDSLQNYA